MGLTVLSILAFQAAWVATALGAATGRPEVAVAACVGALALALVCRRDRRSVVVLAVASGLLGFAAESLMIATGLLTHASPGPWPPLAPLWMMTLWMAFATLIEPTFRWLQGRSLLAGLLGAVGGPPAYLAAQHLGALTLAEPLWPAALALALLWAIALPLLVELSHRLARLADDA
jgi:hypothetical protein